MVHPPGPGAKPFDDGAWPIRSRENQSGRPRTPIIAPAANALSHQVDEYLAAGMDAHVAKPIEAERVHAALQSAPAPAAPSPVVITGPTPGETNRSSYPIPVDKFCHLAPLKTPALRHVLMIVRARG
jgi:hypothetical protein